MTRLDIRNDILRRVWIEDPDNAPAYVLQDVATAVNQALQRLWLARGSEFFTSVDEAVTVTGGSRSVALPSGVQTVLACRLSDGLTSLRPVFSLDDILHYRTRYEGAVAESAGTPRVFWVEVRRNEGADTVDCVLYIAPTPSSSTALSVETKGEAPIYTVAQMADNAATIGVAHQYVESLFLPVARYESTRFYWFRGDEPLRESLREAAALAMSQQGLAVPWPESPKVPEVATAA